MPFGRCFLKALKRLSLHDMSETGNSHVKGDFSLRDVGKKVERITWSTRQSWLDKLRLTRVREGGGNLLL